MSLRLKNIIYTLGLLSAMFLVWHYRQGKTEEMQWITGKTMGPISYNIKYFDDEKRNFKYQIDSLLTIFNQSLNTYIPTSEISQFNKNQSFDFQLPYFHEALSSSKKIYELTDGAFDPSIGALINAWGFGPETGFVPDSIYIDSVLQFTGFDKVKFSEKTVAKIDPRTNISFSASAKGYGVDVVADYLIKNGVNDFFVEIGGEVKASGQNKSNDKIWTVGILHPNSDEINQFFYAIAGLENQAMATSGNYFNYHIVDGKKYGHTISPKTGYPIEHNLLSATVFALTCQEADAIATAFMVMGTEASISFLKKNEEYSGFLVYNDENGELQEYISKDMIGQIKMVE